MTSAADSPISAVMTTLVLSVSAGTELADLRAGMVEQGLHFVPVVDDGEPIGVVTPWDLLAAGDDSTAADVMVSPIIWVAPDTTLAEAARLMRYNAIRHLLVVDEGRMVGSVSSFDLLAALADA